MKPAVGHFVRQYLDPTDTFIYTYLAGTKQFDAFVFAETALNLEDYPAACTYLIEESEIGLLKRDLAEKFEPFIRTFLGRLDYPNCYERHIREQKIGLLHAHFGTMGRQALGLKRRLKIPLITTFYGFDASRLLKSPGSRQSFRQLFQEGDLFLALGPDMAERLEESGCPQEKLRVLHLGIDLKEIPFHVRRCPRAGERIVLLYCGRLVEKKGIAYALEAFGRLAERWKTLEFRIVGDGVLRSRSEQMVRRMRLEDRVVFLGSLSHEEVLVEMEHAHLFVLPSVTAASGDMEGTPTVLLEAQASGLPVVSTHHADIPAIVSDTKSGFLVPERDGEALAERLDALLSHPEMWAEMGRAGRRLVEQQHDVHQKVAQLEAFYLEQIED